MLAPLSMIATVTAFSLFTAYQFLSSNEVVSNPESKMRPYPSCVYQWLCAYMMEMIATSFFFAYCVSNFEFLILYFQGTLTTAWIRVTIQRLQKKERGAVLCSLLLDFIWPHVYHLFLWSWPHVEIGMLLLYSICFSSLPAEQFSSASTTPNWWPHINHSVLRFDHIFDHKQNRSTRRQECTRV